MKLTAKQKAIVEAIKKHGALSVGRSTGALYKSHMTLVDKGILQVVKQGEYHTTFDLVKPSAQWADGNLSNVTELKSATIN